MLALAQSSDGTLATIATWGIAHMRARPAQDALLRLASGDGAPDSVRIMACLGLGGARDGRSKAALRAIMDDARRSDAVRAAAAFALGAAPDRETRATMLAAVTAGPLFLRAAAAAVLGRAEQSVAHEHAEVLARALFAPDSVGLSLRRVAARALANLAAPEESSADRRVFDDPLFARSGDGMLRALLDPPERPLEGGPALRRFSRQILGAAVEALGGLQERVQLVLAAFSRPGALLPLVTTEHGERDAATRAALERLFIEVAPSVAQHVTHPNVTIRRGVVNVLAAAGSAGVEGLTRAVEDEDESVAARAIDALRPFVGQSDVEAALARRLTSDATWPVRAAVASALREGRSDGARSALLQALRGDPFAYVRVAAARSLRGQPAFWQHPSVQDALARVAREDADPSVRDAAEGSVPLHEASTESPPSQTP
jgi:HEAT repeat protein